MPLATDKITIVTGPPRSGTSLAMSMLNAAGLRIIAQGSRPPDRFNPNGYFEDMRVLKLGASARFLYEQDRGAVKIPLPQIAFLPADLPANVIWMSRNPMSVARSQFGFIHTNPSQAELKAAAARILEESALAMDAIGKLPLVNVLEVEFERLLESPSEQSRLMANFLGRPDSAEAMSNCIDPKLGGGKAEATDKTQLF